jgi:Ca2+-transporting ATPase
MHATTEPSTAPEKAKARPFWAMTYEAALTYLRSDASVGLSSDQARSRFSRFGPNVLRGEKRTSRLLILIRQFKSPVVLTLLGATVLSATLGDWVDAIAILSILAINSLIGFVQEVKAEEAVEALRKLASPRARVIRDGSTREVPAAELCPGDILVLEAGDLVPADARVVVVSQLCAGEAMLTGESLPVEKSAGPLDPSAPLAERSNMLFSGTMVETGSGKAVVTATGMETEIGRIAGLLEGAQSGPTPLQARLEALSNRLLLVCGGVVGLVALFGVLHREPWLEVVMSGVSLAVAAVPEGLPTVVTLALALAVRRMVKRNAIVRHLPAVETLGSTDVICTDKTGTLTTGRMRAREIYAGGALIDVARLSATASADVRRLARISVLCSNASIGSDGQASGDPTEVALLWMARDAGVEPALSRSECPRRAEWAFDSHRKRMSVLVEENGRPLLCVKGAPESVLSLCELDAQTDKAAREAMESLSAQGRRLLAVAERWMPSGETPPEGQAADLVERGLRFLGLVAISDPPRPESLEAIRACKDGGIRVVMITGDHPRTAAAVAAELGIPEPGRADVLSGPELDKLSFEELQRRIEGGAVYARVSPENKLDIVRAWKARGSVVAMTGDGVNDAPALKEASIGVSMGRGGTEVARQASSMILTDDNFATIVSAVEEGRAIYGNIKRTIAYLLSGNFAEILVMLGAAMLGWPAPLAPIHLLWINLVTDGLPALALAAEPVPPLGLREMKRPSSRGFDARFYWGVGWVGLMTALMTLAVYGYSLRFDDEITARTNAFSFLVFAELFRSFASRSETRTFLQMGVRSNLLHLAAASLPAVFQMLLHHTHWFDRVFKTVPISWFECLGFFALALAPVSVIEAWKLVGAWRRGRAEAGPR